MNLPTTHKGIVATLQKLGNARKVSIALTANRCGDNAPCFIHLYAGFATVNIIDPNVQENPYNVLYEDLYTQYHLTSIKPDGSKESTYEEITTYCEHADMII